ncbi:hypothetical protein NRIC_10110 [Enterococcus florum]|uniref:Uncharacterized protein n=1 Tax=Enterococcus florum TaxID=2480627 RepID=A0A4P5P5Z2_9ENTE|nr:hypothetical protein NRIC_10110 [Enterococcus florum]
MEPKSCGFNISSQDTYDLVHILTPLTIFPKDGICRFTKMIHADFQLTQYGFDPKNDKYPAKESPPKN